VLAKNNVSYLVPGTIQYQISDEVGSYAS